MQFLGGDVPEGVELRDLGAHDLKDVGEARIYQLALQGQEAAIEPLKAERRGAGPSKADILGEDFEQRIADFVQQSIAGSLSSPPPPAKPPSKSVRELLSRLKPKQDLPPSS